MGCVCRLLGGVWGVDERGCAQVGMGVGWCGAAGPFCHKLFPRAEREKHLDCWIFVFEGDTHSLNFCGGPESLVASQPPTVSLDYFYLLS